MLYCSLLFIEERRFLMEKFRKTTEEDLVELMALFEEGIAFLKAQGSPQWQDGYGPKENQIKADIANGESYVLVKDGKIAASAALVSGDDPVYKQLPAQGGMETVRIYPFIASLSVLILKGKS